MRIFCDGPSAIGTFRTWPLDATMSAARGKAEVVFRSRQVGL